MNDSIAEKLTEFLKWVDSQTEEYTEDDRGRLELVRTYLAEKEEARRVFSLKGMVGERVWVHLPGEDRMNDYEGIITSIELGVNNEVLAYLEDKRYYDPISFEILKYRPHLIKD